MKKINLIICFLILIGFSFIYKPINVDAEYLSGEGVLTRCAMYPDESVICPGIIGLGVANFSFNNLLDPSTHYIQYSPNDLVYLYLNPTNMRDNPYLELGEIYDTVVTTFYIVSNYDIPVGLYDVPWCNANTNLCNFKDYIKRVRIYDAGFESNFAGEPNMKAPVYKFVVEWEIWDILDTYPVGLGVGGDTAWLILGTNRNAISVMTLHSVEKNTISKVISSPPPTDIGEDEPKLGVWETIKALPGKLLTWFTHLPSSIWNFLETGFTWVTDSIGDLGGFILDLPGNIWNGIKSGFNWIVDGISNLFDFFNKDDDIDLSIIDNMVGDNIHNSGTRSSGWLPPGPVDTVLNLPFSFLDNLNTNLSKSCKEVTLPLPYVNKNLPLPCVNSIYKNINGLSTWVSSISVILSGLILFKYLINLYRWVDKTLSFKDNNHLENWGGL